MEDKLRALELKFVLAISIGLLGLYYFMYYSPPNEASTIAGYEDELNLLDGEIKKLDREIGEGDQVKANLEKIKKEVKALSSFFEIKPNSKSIEQIISEEARATGISFTSLQAAAAGYEEPYDPNAVDATQPLTAKDYVKRNIIEANFTGTFIELMRFLSYLSRIDKVISLKQIELKSESGAGPTDSLKLAFKAEFETYEIVKDVNAESLAPAPPPTEEVAQ